MDVFSFHAGDAPLLVSIPHDGCHVPADIRDQMTPAGLALPDTDWHVAELYGFARELGLNMLVANYSRYVIDLNRPASDEDLYPGQVATGLCPLQTFAGDDIYASPAIDSDELQRRVAAYWQPYHDQLASVLESTRKKYGYALLWDAHSISSVVPRLFGGELPELNIGTDGRKSCSREIENAVVRAAEASQFGYVANGRFQGGSRVTTSTPCNSRSRNGSTWTKRLACTIRRKHRCFAILSGPCWTNSSNQRRD
jgi:N-formylglutamate amidohydrolase